MFRFSLQLFLEEFLILRITDRAITTNVYRSSCTVTVILSDFNETLTSTTDFL